MVIKQILREPWLKRATVNLLGLTGSYERILTEDLIEVKLHFTITRLFFGLIRRYANKTESVAV